MKKSKYFDKIVREPRENFDYFRTIANPLIGTYNAESIRRKFQASSGNIAIGFIVTPAESITCSFFSKDQDLLPEKVPCAGLTETYPERRFCTEFRILNGLILEEDITPSTIERIDIYTENAPGK
jgi:hypothetical protein